MSGRIRIVVIDPYPIFRQGVIRTIARSEDMVLVGEGATAADALRLAGTQKPDLVIVDIAIPDSLAAVKEMTARGFNCAAVTALDDQLSISNALAAGVTGYVLKGASGLDLIEAIKAIHCGQSYISAELALPLLMARETLSILPKRDAKVVAALNYREQQLLDHITEGLTNKEIAQRLGLTLGTIKVYLSTLFKKMNVRNRVEAVIAARGQQSM
jgi:DNA-binding NarL/FixJ family response regulator